VKRLWYFCDIYEVTETRGGATYKTKKTGQGWYNYDEIKEKYPLLSWVSKVPEVMSHERPVKS
jgi:hypothetical protein